ncbi:MAG TPA: FGGY family carbohydrate kinase [Candidatus Limnocylindrales bacterium]|nr:FGGY family carbohydrate kinase [Candidatus Limnocylindrales bacterium]
MASDPLILALDLGLTHAKAVVFAADGRLVERESVPYPTQRPASDRVEQEPDDWWSALATAARVIGRRSPEILERVEAMSVTGHMHGLVLEGADRRPVGPALVLGDRRATREAEETIDQLGADWIAHTTGATLDPSMPAAELRWLADHEPQRLRGATLVTGPKDHLRGRLTDDRLTEPIDACATSLYDIRRRRWSPELLAAAGVAQHLMPEVVACETVAGPLLPGPATELGIRQGIPVVVGVGDDVEILGGGLLDPGEALEHLGTTGSILTVTSEPLDDPRLALELYPHVLPDRWVLGGSMTTAGAALGWVAGLLGYAGIEDMLSTLDDIVAPGRSGEGLAFIASMAGDRCPVRDPSARGAWVGLDTTFDRRGLARAAFSGVAESLARILRAIEDLAGPHQTMIVSAGGVDLDPRWTALRAATYGLPMATLESPEPTALGLATVIAAGIGLHPDVRTAVTAMARRSGEIVGADRTVKSPDRLRRAASADAAIHSLRIVWPSLVRS